MKGDYEAAVDLLLKPRAESASREAMLGKMRQVWSETKDAQKALEQIEKKHMGEAKVLKFLCSKERDFLGAISTIPRTRLRILRFLKNSFLR